MIKVNLLDSVTDRAKGVAAVEERVTSPRAQTILMAVVVSALLVVGVAYDYTSSKAEHSAAEVELAKQRAIQQQMQLVNKEQADLALKTAEVQNRIDAIQKLRASQQGPGDVLREVKERIDTIPGLYLESVEQKGNELVIKGGSPNEGSVARLGQSLEFSSGRFSDLNIETERKPVEQTAAVVAQKTSPAAPEVAAVKPELVTFTIKCNYTPNSKAEAAAPGTPVAANQVAKQIVKAD
jgi:Tfp pilus assembly protein PilN